MPGEPEVSVPAVRFEALIQGCDTVLFDAYGVLVHGTGAMPGAAAALALLAQAGKAACVVTNDASKLPEAAAARFARLGLPLLPAQVVTSGMLLAGWFQRHGLEGARCAVLGPSDAKTYVRRAGAEVVPVDAEFDVLALCDESGFDFLRGVDGALTSVLRALDAGRAPRLVLPNPDLVYPEGENAFGFAAGAVAGMFEAALARCHPGRGDLRFEALGKPGPDLFRLALEQTGTPAQRALMVGDQVETDIAGANAAGIPSALLTLGVSRTRDLDLLPPGLRPTWQMSRLD